MMRLLFLCLLLLPAATAVSEDIEGSADVDNDDEDLYEKRDAAVSVIVDKPARVPTFVDKTTGEEDKSDQLTLIVIIAAVAVVALSVAAIVAIMLVRRRMQSRQQGVYSVPTEQDQKAAV